MNILIDRFNYKDLETRKRMEDIRNIINNYIDDKIVNDGSDTNGL